MLHDELSGRGEPHPAALVPVQRALGAVPPADAPLHRPARGEVERLAIVAAAAEVLPQFTRIDVQAACESPNKKTRLRLLEHQFTP